jgi:beta-ring hydroxylase
MRLYPQPPVLLRRAIEDVRMGPYEVPAGSDIFISTWNLHRSPLLWDRPHDFDPMRFGPLEAPMPNEFTENYRYLPFGGGQRKCIGDQFALLESIAALSVICRRFDFELDPAGPEVGMTTGATIHTSNGLLLRLHPRNVPPSQGHAPAPAPAADAGGGGCPMGFGAKPAADAAVAR